MSSGNGDATNLRFAKWISVIIFCLLAVGLFSVFTVFILQYILPSHWTWIELSRLDKLQAILFSGFAGAVLSPIIKGFYDRLRSQ